MKRTVCAGLKFTLLALMMLAAASCSSSSAGEGRCGDGVCDEAEQANPNLCPQDCRQEASAGSESDSEAESHGSEWSARVVWDCDATYAAGQVDRWSVEINYDFTVGADNSITGSGEGTATRAECERPNCSCSITIDDFTVSVSGFKQDDQFSIQLDPVYNMQQCIQGGQTCPGCVSLQQLQGCVCVSGPLDLTIDAQDGASRSFECNPEMFSPAVAHGNTVITEE